LNRRIVLTGAFSYIGGAVASRLLQEGYEVHTLTGRKKPLGAEAITTAPLRFDPEHLRNELRGAEAFINTYWVRLPWGDQSFETAVENSKMLLRAAADAGVPRIVHVSVSNASQGRNLGYYNGKAEVDEYLRGLGVSHGIVRPTLVVGESDVLTNNIAWFLRYFPLFALPRASDCLLRPVTLQDTARIIVDQIGNAQNTDVDAAGPQVITFSEYIQWLARACGVKRAMVNVPNGIALAALRVVGLFLRDVVLTREELLGLQQELLNSDQEPLGHESVQDWLTANGNELGVRYVNDMRRHFGSDSHKAVTDGD